MIEPPDLLHKQRRTRITPLTRVVLVLLGLAAGIAVAWGLSRVVDSAGALELVRAPDETEVASTGQFEIHFSSPLDPQAFHDYVRVEPALEGEWELQGATATFHPGGALEYRAHYTVALRAGLPALDGSSLPRSENLQFVVRTPMVVYLQEGGSRMMVQSLDGGAPELLFGSSEPIIEIDPSPGGQAIAFSVANASGGQDLWVLERDSGVSRILLNCDADVCDGLDWSPDGERLAFARREQGLDPDLASPRLWTISVVDRAAAPLYQDERILGRDPVWSPDGLALAFYDPGARAVRILDIDTVREQLIPSASGRNGGWAPDSESFVLARQQFEEEQVSADIIVVDTRTRDVRLLTNPEQDWLDIVTPAWSPDGEWIAFAGQSASAGLAKGLFLIRPDGSEIRQVESQPRLSHGGYSWDPRAEMLLFQRFALDNPDAEPVVAAWRLESGAVIELASGAYAPAWLP